MPSAVPSIVGLIEDLDRTMNVPAVKITALDLPSLPPASLGSRKPAIPGYEVLGVLGKGGEGTVWEAVETKLDRRVAIKIHSTRATADDAANLWTEARVAARIGDPSIVTVLDVGLTLDGRRFYAMELVRGTDVAEMIKAGPLTPRRALEIAADVARAVAAAHEHGVVHRDLKPRNVIVDVANRARVVDFGIALDLRSGGDRLAGMVAGSPKYMSPEQIRGGTVGPFTDIWAIGVLLFEMLTGVSPFERKTFREILGAIGIDDPGAPSTLVKGIHRDIDAIVRRCLEPARSDRFPSAAALHEAIRGVLEGQRPGANDIEPAYRPRPSLPEADAVVVREEEADKTWVWTWTLKSSPAELWPHLGDTSTMGEAVGTRPMVIETKENEAGRPIQVGKISALGMDVTWQELPFEWVVESEHSKVRIFDKGPFHALWHRLILTPRADGGTDLRQEIAVKTRNWLGRAFTYVELERRLAHTIERYYRSLDSQIQAGLPREAINAYSPTSSQRSHIADGVKKLEAQGFDAKLVKALEGHLLHAPSHLLAALRPLALADRWQTSRPETVDAFIHAAKHGLLVATWSVLCPVCRVACGHASKLDELGPRSRCAKCAVDFQTDLEESVELVFTPHPSVREVSKKIYCFGAPVERPHVLAQKKVSAKDEVTMNVALEPGSYRVVGEHTRVSCEILATATGFLERAILDFDGKKIEGGGIVVRAGAVAVCLRNTSGNEELFRLERCEPARDRFTAARALTHPAFRELFAHQLPKDGTCLAVKELSFVFVRFPNLDQLEDLDDAAACLELSRWKSTVAEVATRFGGTVVPSTLSLVAVAFSSDVVAIRSAFAIHESNRSVAIAVHQGGCVGATHNGRLELFGESLRRGEALVQECPSGQIGVSNTMMANPNVSLLVSKGRREPITAPAGKQKPKLVLIDQTAA